MATRGETPEVQAPEWSLTAARVLAADSGRRTEIPLRNSFVRNDDPAVTPPLSQLVSSGGRGGAVAIKLYMALVWRCSGEPFDTDILARQWAALLGLDEPNTLGSRRVTKALNVLESHGLVELQRRRGESTVVTILEESGSGNPYDLPSTSHERSDPAIRSSHRYFKVPLSLWTNGHVQVLSAAATAMLLVLIEERNLDGRPTWWSTERFPDFFNLTPSTRSKGTGELASRGLVGVRKQLIDGSNAGSLGFSRQRVRNLYELRGDARPLAMRERQKALSLEKKRKPVKF